MLDLRAELEFECEVNLLDYFKAKETMNNRVYTLQEQKIISKTKKTFSKAILQAEKYSSLRDDTNLLDHLGTSSEDSDSSCSENLIEKTLELQSDCQNQNFQMDLDNDN